jgi:hypothetical protein
MPSTRTTVQRHSPTVLTPFVPNQSRSKKSRTAPPSSRRVSTIHTGGFSIPSGKTSLATHASPFPYNAATVAPNSGELVYTTAMAIPTEFRRTHTDDDDATFLAPPSTRFADHRYVFRRHERLHILSRPASTTCLFKTYSCATACSNSPAFRARSRYYRCRAKGASLHYVNKLKYLASMPTSKRPY